MKSLLRLKHWQLFTLILTPCFISRLFTVRTLPSGWQPSFIVFAAMLLLVAGIVFSWLYAVGTSLQNQLPAAVSMSITRFKIALFIPSAYITLMCAGFGGILPGAANGIDSAPIMVVIPLHLLSMAGIFYAIYFNAKSLKSVELQRPVVLADYLGEIFLFWFSPLGLWVIQPRLNAIFSYRRTS